MIVKKESKEKEHAAHQSKRKQIWKEKRMGIERDGRVKMIILYITYFNEIEERERNFIYRIFNIHLNGMKLKTGRKKKWGEKGMEDRERERKW